METEPLNVRGVVRGQGSRYAGTDMERLVVHLTKGDDESTPNPHSLRLPITLVIDGRDYTGGLLLRTEPAPYASLSPDLTDDQGNATNLATVLARAGVAKNAPLAIELAGMRVKLSPS
ncbi:MAG: hypothetical protein FJ304_20270 [Planctomycetes bacterium]|nr:hypothetical protein [Planctomycetota bacterium]